MTSVTSYHIGGARSNGCNVRALTPQGRLVALLTHPDFFGERSLMADGRSNVTVRTITMCSFMLLETDGFYDFLEQAPPASRTRL